MQITNSTNSYLTNEVSNTKPISTTSVATKQDTAAETVSKSFDTFEYSTPQANIGTTYSAKTLVATTNSVNTTSSSSTELSIYGLIARRAGVPTTSGGEPYINNATDAQKYSAALKSYNESLNKAAYFADLDVDSNGNAIFSMVLNNLNATRTCTDYRLGTNMAHPADPFTVMMANINTTIAPTYNSTEKTYNYNTTSDDSDPVLCDWTEIVQGFGYASFEQATINVNSHTAIASLLSEHPEGLIADVGSHYLVICGDRGSSYGTDRFYVCDPGTAYAYKGCYKPFTARGTYDINSIISIYFID